MVFSGIQSGNSTDRALRVNPPEGLVKLVGGFYESVGEEFCGYLKSLCALQPDHAVLDIGSGCGRIAVPLTGYLNARGRYEGIEIHPDSVRWCRDAISSKRPEFGFQTADLYNGFYNPSGSCRARDYRFPFPDESFDVVLFVSVFTHMLPEDIPNYLREAFRVLKKGGKVLATFFLINPESWKSIQDKVHEFPYERAEGGYYYCNAGVHEDVTAHDESWVLDAFRGAGFSGRPEIHYGRWTRRPRYLSFQDLLVAVRSGL